MRDHRVRRRVSAVGTSLAIVIVLAGCGGIGDTVSERVAEEVAGRAMGGDVNVDTGDGSFSVGTDEGSYSVGQSLPDGFPSQMPLPPSHEIVSGVTGEEDGRVVFMVQMTTQMSVDDLVAFYERALSSGGWTIEEEGADQTSGDLRIVVMGASGHGYEAGVNITAPGSGDIAIMLMVFPDREG